MGERQKLKAIILQHNLEYYIEILAILLWIIGSGEFVLIGQRMVYIALTWAVELFLLAVLAIKRKQWNKNCIIFGGIMIILVLLSMVVNKDYGGDSVVALILITAVFVCEIDINHYIRIFVSVVSLIAVISLFIEFVFFIYPDFIHLFPYFSNSNVKVNILGFCVHGDSTMRYYRNYGCFFEPAIFGIYLSIAIMLNLLTQGAKSKLQLAILNIALVTTWSMTGFVAILFFYFMYFFIEKKSRVEISVIGLVGITSLFVVRKQGMWLYEYLILRFSPSGPSAHSVWSRINSLIIPIKIWIKKPFFGVGAINSQKEFLQYIENTRVGYAASSCFTNQITYYLASFGLMFVLVVVAGLFFFGKALMKHNAWSMVWVVTILLLLMGEILSYSPIIFVIVLYGFNEIGRTR